MKTTIIDYGYNCEGVGRYNGKVVFIPYTILGEEIEFEKQKEKASFIKGKVKNVLSQNNRRIIPPCQYFGTCGGCSLQHVGIDDENEIKKKIIASHFKKLGFENEIEVISCNDYFYRNKIKLFCNDIGLGLKRPDSDNVVNIEKCLIVNSRINSVISMCEEFIEAKKIVNKIEKVLIRTEGLNALVCFYFKEKVNVEFQGLQIMLGKGSGIYVSYMGKDIKHVIGAKYLTENFMEIKIEYDITTFKQVNDGVAKKLYTDVIESIYGKEVINGYSGAGLLTALIAKKGIKCIGIEIGESEHRDAEKLKAQNKLNKMINYKGDCGEILPKVISNSVSTIIIDPARRGCERNVLLTINKSKAKIVIYISCDVATQIRDLKLLDNYKIKSVKLYNMFPQTAKSETLVILERNL